MFEPRDPGDFGNNLLKLLKKLYTQNLILKVSVGVLGLALLITHFRKYHTEIPKNEHETT
jgi:hypothetical protein